MAELINTFSWSFSAASDFEACRRRRFWAKYAMWGGWKRDASELQRTAYRLTKMDNRYTLRGHAAEEAVMFMLRRAQRGENCSEKEAYNEVARPMLNRAWKDSRDRKWMDNPKRFSNLHEHYYPQLLPEQAADWPQTVAAEVKQCIANFKRSFLPRFSAIRPEQEVMIATPDGGGDPESFELHGVKIYAIPDYVYKDGDTWHIHDWKSGRQSEQHLQQLKIYGLWAHTKHGVPVDRMMLHAEYLLYDHSESTRMVEEDLGQITETIGNSVAEMTEYLVDFDRKKNRPAGRAEWDLADEPGTCARCAFYELCEPELR